MAPGMKTWYGAVGVGVVTVTAWLLGPGRGLMRGVPEEPMSAEQRAYGAARVEVLIAKEKILRLKWADELVARVQATRVGDAPARLVDLGIPEFERGERERAGPSKNRPDTWIRERRQQLFRTYSERWLNELDAAGRGSEPVDLGVFVIRIEEGSNDLDPRWSGAHTEYYVGEANGHPYCVTALVRVGSSSRDVPQIPTAIGSCAWVGQYGLPGTQIGEWLKAGAYGKGAATMPELGRTLRKPSSLAAQRCLRDDTAVCGRTFMGEEHDLIDDMVAGGVPQSSFIEFAGYASDALSASLNLRSALSKAVPELWVEDGAAPFGVMEAEIFLDLQEEFGPQRFEKFWKSEKAVPAAFQEAFGIGHAEWINGWAHRRFDAVRDNVNAKHVAQAVILPVLLLGLVMSVAMRRQVA